MHGSTPPARLLLLVCLAGCGGVEEGGGAGTDAGDDARSGDANHDAGMDAAGQADAAGADDAGDDGGEPDAACLPRAIFLGGTDAEEQGWTVTSSGTANMSMAGPSITQIETDTAMGDISGGMLLLSRPDVVEPGEPYAIELVLQVLRVDPHNFLDGAVVLMGSYTGGFGDGADRAEMLYIDADAIGWTDDTDTAAAASIDGAFHTYVLAVDAAGNATVTRDGVSLITRAGFTTNGTIAFGDQTNDGDIDAQLWIRSVSLLCP